MITTSKEQATLLKILGAPQDTTYFLWDNIGGIIERHTIYDTLPAEEAAAKAATLDAIYTVDELADWIRLTLTGAEVVVQGSHDIGWLATAAQIESATFDRMIDALVDLAQKITAG